MKVLETGRITRIQEIRPGIFSLWASAPEICSLAVPGQFVHVRIKDQFLPLLRRPLSIGRVEENQLELVWRVVGEGTRLLGQLGAGDDIDLLGPLGHGFTIPDDAEQFLLIGGGLGMPPMVYLYNHLTMRGRKATLFLGVRGRDDIPLSDDDPILSQARIVAENGEGFRKGLVTEPVNELLDELATKSTLTNTALYSCGPWGLIGALQRTIPQQSLLLTEVSLEQQMGCGIGVCQGCAVEAEGGPTPYRLVCSDGPVFDLFSVEVPGAK
ncbi:dihydroorotate dehydrogenase electron transfer subunit [bacterium]|nr:dihydroorotate dehydrogenase electron transfer subunit [bacterium]